jgi:hypothetical protein
VGRLLGEQDEYRGAHVPASGPPARAELVAKPSRTAEPGGEVRSVEGGPSAAVTVPSALLQAGAEVVVEACGGVLARRPVFLGMRVGVFSGHVGSLRGG